MSFLKVSSTTLKPVCTIIYEPDKKVEKVLGGVGDPIVVKTEYPKQSEKKLDVLS